jgi:hypothetical protein
MGPVAARLLQSIDDWFFNLPPEVEAIDEAARQELATRCRAFQEVDDAAGLDAAAHSLVAFLKERDLPTGETEMGLEEATRAAAFADTPQTVDYLKNKFIQLADRIVKTDKE